MWQAIKNIYHLLQGVVAVLMYRFPARKLTVIGVTGTDGKTTTSSLLYHVITQAGKKAAIISSISATIGNTSASTGYHITTPGRFALQKYLSQAKKEKVDYVILEISSHGLDQHRDFGVPFAIGVVTNIGNEHLDYHKTYEKYVKAKAKLLRKAKTAIVNKEDKSYKYLKPLLRHHHVLSYGFKNDANVNIHNFPFQTKLIGEFNKYNCLAAIATLRELHFSDSQIKSGIASFKSPLGRQEVVYDKDFTVMIDFAHTPLAFKGILPSVRKITKGRLIHVFGAASKRDTYKRPEMGKLSSEYADIIVLTAEDPRGESIEAINSEIAKAIDEKKFARVYYRDDEQQTFNNKCLIEIADRRAAIKFAVAIAKRGDTVLLTGKGHEQSMNYGNGEEHWSEHEAVEEALEAKK